MTQFVVDPAFWTLFPEGQINLLVLKGIENTSDSSQQVMFQELLKTASNEAQTYFVEEVFSKNPVIHQWRQAFSQFKTKKGARSSIESLLKRVSQGHEFRSISPLVDMYNSISIKYAVPVGGEDIDSLQGDLHLGLAKGGESFFPLGAAEDAPALEGELCYFDDQGAVCRSLNWREAQRTMLQENTKNAVLVIESINQEQAKRSNKAIEELKTITENYFKITGQTYKLTPTFSSVQL